MMLLVQPKTRPHSPCSAPFPCRRGSKQHVQRGPRPFSSPPPPRPSRLPPSRPLKCMKSMAPRARTALDAPKPLRSRPRRPPPPPPPSRRWPRRKASRPGWRRWRPPGASEAQRPGGNEPLPTHSATSSPAAWAVWSASMALRAAWRAGSGASTQALAKVSCRAPSCGARPIAAETA